MSEKERGYKLKTSHCGKCGKSFRATSLRPTCYECVPKRAKKESPYPDKIIRGPIKDFTCEECNKPFRSVGARKKCFDCQPRKEVPRGKSFRSDKTGARVMLNDRGVKVSPDKRPSDGWGMCNFVDSKTAGKCTAERWSGRGIFCHYHMELRHTEKVEREKKSEGLAAVDAEIDKKKFFFEKAQDAINLLSEVNFAVYKGWLPSSRAARIGMIVRIQIKGLDSKIIAMRLYAIIKGLKESGADVLPTMQEIAEIEKDAELGRSLGLNDVVDDVYRAVGSQGKLGEAGRPSQPGERTLLPSDVEKPIEPARSNQPVDNPRGSV
jgi:hypothetical protein